MSDQTGVKLINIDDYKPHIVLELIDGDIDCAPLLMYENIIKGRLKITDVEDWEILMRSIIKNWLTWIK